MMLLPADTHTILGIRLKELKKSPLYQQLAERRKLPQLDQFTAATGIDPRKEIWEIVVASTPQVPVVLVRGRFVEGGGGAAGMEPSIQRPGLRRLHYKGYTLIGDDQVVVTFLNTSVAVAGQPEAVRRIIDGRDGSLGRPPRDLLSRIARIPSVNEMYLVSKAPVSSLLSAGFSGPLAGLKSMPVEIQMTTLATDWSAGVHLTGEIVSRDEASARKLHEAVRGLIGLARLSAADGESRWSKFFDSVQLQHTGAKVELDAHVPLDLWERFLETAGNPWQPNPSDQATTRQ